jgi:hypothetical protein
MSEMQQKYEGSASSLDEGLFVLALWTLVWGPVVAVALLGANKMLLLATPIVFIAAFCNGNRKPVLMRYRSLIVVLAAFLAGYCWYAFLEQSSEESKARASALEACTKFQPCVDRVQLSGFEIGPFRP